MRAFTDGADRARVHERLRGLLGSVDGVSGPDRLVASGWPRTDRALRGGLARGAVHEWYAERPPLSLLVHLARRGLACGARERDDSGSRVLWIGREVWPYPRVLADDLELRSRDAEDRLPDAGDEAALHVEALELVPRMPRTTRSAERRPDLLARSLFVDAPFGALRLWAIESALRSPAVAAVVAHGQGLDMAATRRLQLAAEAGGGLGLLARPLAERGGLSAAATRWWVRRLRARAEPARPSWTLALVRRKGVLDRGGDLGVACPASSP